MRLKAYWLIDRLIDWLIDWPFWSMIITLLYVTDFLTMLKWFRQQDWTRYNDWPQCWRRLEGFRSTKCSAVLRDRPQRVQPRWPRSGELHREDLMDVRVNDRCAGRRRCRWMVYIRHRREAPLFDDVTNHIKYRHAVGSRDHWHVSVCVFPRIRHRSQ